MDSKPQAPPSEGAAYPRMSPEDLAPPPPPVVAPAGSNPYVLSSPSSGPPAKSKSPTTANHHLSPRLLLSAAPAPVPRLDSTWLVFSFAGGMVSVCADVSFGESIAAGTKENLREMFGSVGKRFSEAARKTEGIAGDVWQHLKTGPSITDAAMGRIAQVSKVISEGGYDKIFQQTFECLPDEKLKKAYACYLSTSHGPIMGVLYVSTAKLAFCSDSPVAYVTEDNQTASAIYKIVVPVPHLRSVTPTASQQNPAERYIQVVSVDNHDFWFMGFVNYDSAVKCLQDAARGGA
ncbi:hypothetical protein CFC21_022423 [Triticum aestivum]|uniref:GRAM domain-containing protein n=2 Tax=Triticum aestivum TaxID=4565 RepID=A0A9R1J7T8_WHEAT|nr:hypothetical protein CFC21_022423 [Triticum aestivum]